MVFRRFKFISVVVPIYRSESYLPELWERVSASLGQYCERFELICVDDASPDNSWNWIQKKSLEDSRVKGVRLRRNRGQQVAVLCGLRHASGDIVVTMDADMQHKPEDIYELLLPIEDGKADVVVAKFLRKEHSVIRNVGTLFVRYITSKSIGVPSHLELTSFRAIRRSVLIDAISLNHQRPVIGFLLFQVTDRFVNVSVEHQQRKLGHSSYSYYKLAKYFAEQIIEYSDLPLMMMSAIGTLFAFTSLGYGLIIFAKKILGFPVVSGFTTLVVLITFFGGLILLSLGIIGKYLSKVLRNQGQTPSYVIEQKTIGV